MGALARRRGWRQRRLWTSVLPVGAVLPALGTGIGELLSWGDMEVVRRQSGEPEMVLRGAGLGFCSQHGIEQIKISLTHAKLYAAANAVALSIS